MVSLVLFLSFGLQLLGADPKHSAPQHNQVQEELRVSITVSHEQQGTMGLKTTKALKRLADHKIRTVGNITADERNEAHFHTRVNGWIERVFADYVGKPIQKGQPLFDLYSPELVSTQEELLVAKRQGANGSEIAQASLDRLRLWEVPKTEVDSVIKSGKAKKAITFVSPVTGFILGKTAINGMYITPEMELYHIADLSRIWIVVTLYEYDIAAIHVGDVAEIQLPYDPNKNFKARLTYIYPEIDTDTRTGKARIELDNINQNLKPGMFANVVIEKSLGEAIVVPDDAVIDTGLRKIVFVRIGQQFEPKEVSVGPRVGNEVTILSGLMENDEVVTSAHFLIDAESKFQAAVKKDKPAGGHSGHGSH
ncbi:MAG: efflux RND transporter periplasmic adaptor subunit [Deltaproteobacteria bacterium]|nr:efflux RND transporter periplasmic adaptor subunit [Deltaproteobacteria bacterium]MBI3294973.1 efflux RND transporter periplasmic adaptor subunit [Deltaproteobacteria bacterium]